MTSQEPPSTAGLALASTSPGEAELGPALIRAREQAGLTQDDVAAALQLSRQLVGYWEQGKRKPRTEQLFQLAKLFRTTLSDLLNQVPPVEHAAAQAAAMLYRRSNVELDRAAQDGIAGFFDFLDFYADLAKKMRRSVTGMRTSPFLPGEGYAEYASDARRKASEVRQYLGLGQGPIADTDSVCTALGVTTYRAHLGSDLQSTISGAFYKHPELGFSILVNLDMTRGRRRFTAAHELAHALLHSADDAIVVSDSGRTGDGREAYADAFAGEFLMPEEGIRRALESLGAGPKVEEIEPVIHLQRMFNVSYVTALVRLRQANIITTAMLKKLRSFQPTRAAAQLGYPTGGDWLMENDTLPVRYPLRFRSLLREALKAEVVGRSSSQQALKLSDDDLYRLVSVDPAMSDDDTGQEWDEYAALGAIPA